MTYLEADSGDLHTDFLKGFKNIAGPGSGKTYWLVQNVRNILRNSPKIHSCSKIACISYTNVAVAEFIEELDITSDQIEVSTIHSFLYRNLVKPYFHVISEVIGYAIDYNAIITHVPHVPSSKKVLDWLEWLQTSGIIRNRGVYTNPDSFQNTKITIGRISWKFDQYDNCVLRLCGRNIGLFTRDMLDKFLDYKKQYWEDGIIHHDDVLYFSYLLLHSKPRLLDFLVARYPYIIVDEFQDTSPLQAAILALLGERGSIIGVVGDPAQSIFSFNGAEREKLIEFNPEHQINYKMLTNRRSTQNIITLLNHVRSDDVVDLAQIPLDPTNMGSNVKVIVYSDDLLAGIHNYRSTVGDSSFCILARKNVNVNEIKGLNENVHLTLMNKDSSRSRFYEHIFNSIELTNNGYFGKAVNELLHILRTDSEGKLRRPFNEGILGTRREKQIVASNLLFNISEYLERNPDSTIYQFYIHIRQFLSDIFKLSLPNYRASGNLYDFISVNTISSVIESKNGDYEGDEVRTIHKSKGSEFDTILLVLENERDLYNFVIEPGVKICSPDDECRIIYVALSRAKMDLFIAVPSLDEANRRSLADFNIEVDVDLSVNYSPPQPLDSFFG